MKKVQIGWLIGKKVKVKNARNKSIIGNYGKVIDETKNTLLLQTEKGKKRLIKKQIKLDTK